MEEQNRGKWTGDVTRVMDNLDLGYNVEVKIENVSLRDNQLYTEVLPIRIDDEDVLLKAEEGKKLSFMGIFNTFDVKINGENKKRTVIHADPATVELADDNAPYENYMEMTGELRSKTCRNAIQDKQPWGFCLMQVAGKIFRTVFFGNVLVRMDREATRGSNIKHGGPVRYREYELRSGGKDRMLEVLSQEDYFNILQTAVVENPVAAYTPFNPDAKPKKKASKK
jgi:hypothetical protein